MRSDEPWPSASLRPLERKRPMLNSGAWVWAPVDARTLQELEPSQYVLLFTYRDSIRLACGVRGTPASARCLETTFESTYLGLRKLKKREKST